MQKAIDTKPSSCHQEAYNKEAWHRSKTIVKNIRDLIAITHEVEKDAPTTKRLQEDDAEQSVEEALVLELDMRAKAKLLDFEKAADLRDVILELRASIVYKRSHLWNGHQQGTYQNWKGKFLQAKWMDFLFRWWSATKTRLRNRSARWG